MAKRDDYLWHGMFLHYFFVWMLIVVFLYARNMVEVLTPQNLIMLFFVIMVGDLLVHEVIKMTKWGVK